MKYLLVKNINRNIFLVVLFHFSVFRVFPLGVESSRFFVF